MNEMGKYLQNIIAWCEKQKKKLFKNEKHDLDCS